MDKHLCQRMEGPEPKKEKIKEVGIEYLSNLSNFVEEALDSYKELTLENKSLNDLLSKFSVNIKKNFDYLKKEKDNLSDESFNNIARHIDAFMKMNVKIMRQTEGGKPFLFSELSEIDEYITLSNFEAESSNKLSYFLYNPIFNNFREVLREGITKNILEKKLSDKMRIESLSHLKIFLDFEEGTGDLNESIMLYLQRNYKDEVPVWLPLKMIDFKKYILNLISKNDNESLSEMEDLIRIEKELTSIKENHISAHANKSVSYSERAKKIRFIQDLRFDRVNVKDLNKRIQKEENNKQMDIKNHKGFLGPLLRRELNDFTKEFNKAKKESPEEFTNQMLDYIKTLKVEEKNKKKLIDFIKGLI